MCLASPHISSQRTIDQTIGYSNICYTCSIIFYSAAKWPKVSKGRTHSQYSHVHDVSISQCSCPAAGWGPGPACPLGASSTLRHWGLLSRSFTWPWLGDAEMLLKLAISLGWNSVAPTNWGCKWQKWGKHLTHLTVRKWKVGTWNTC